MNPFEQLLRELGPYFNLNLAPDEHGACRIDFGGGLAIQLELTSTADELLIGTEFGPLEAGSYRYELTCAALRYNGLVTLPSGVFAYSENKNALVFFQFYPLLGPTTDQIYKLLRRFVDQAQLWHEAIGRQEIPQFEREFAR